jgi:hypothetical protein
MAVVERTKEIGTLRALGLKRPGVVILFGIESALLGIIGNYSRCQQNAEQLRQLQQWIIQNKEAVDAMAKDTKK